MQGDSNKEEPKMPVMPLNEKRPFGCKVYCIRAAIFVNALCFIVVSQARMTVVQRCGPEGMQIPNLIARRKRNK